MTEHFVDLTDGTRLPVKVNFGTLYYMQKCKGYERIAKKAKKNPKSLSNSESMDFTAFMIYAMIRSNGRQVSFDEALSLVPPDTEEIKKAVNAFSEEYEKYSKKKASKQMRTPKK